MKHNELLDMIGSFTCCSGAHELALRAVVELESQLDQFDFEAASATLAIIAEEWQVHARQL